MYAPSDGAPRPLPTALRIAIGVAVDCGAAGAGYGPTCALALPASAFFTPLQHEPGRRMPDGGGGQVCSNLARAPASWERSWERG
eukprot:1265454-Prymnesium_polylepis.1